MPVICRYSLELYEMKQELNKNDKEAIMVFDKVVSYDSSEKD
jgi:hypothetical protein